MKFSRMVPVVLALAVVGCGTASSIDAADTTTSLTTAASTGTRTSAATTTTTLQEDPTFYLVEISNGVADLSQSVDALEKRVDEQYADRSTEDDQLAYLEAYFGGILSLYVGHGYWLAGITPPAAFADAHARYADAYLLLYQPILDETEKFNSVADWEEWLPTWFEASDARLDFVDACEEMEETAASGGFAIDLQCPTPPPESVDVRVEVGAVWKASPDLVSTGNVVIELDIINVGSSPVQVVVVDIFPGNPVDLPVENGVVDLARSGESFGVAYPDVFVGEDSQLVDELPEVLPGETVHATVWGSGPIVVFDYAAGRFEAGSYVLIERRGVTE